MKIAFCKFAGLANGGTEKYLQTLAILYKDYGHSVDYYYTNAAKILDNNWVHPDNDKERGELLLQHGVKTIPVYVESRIKNHWNNSNFFEIFKKDYDILITAGNGESEYPYNKIRSLPIIHTIHGFHAHNQQNIKKSVLISKWQADLWAKNGGDVTKRVIIAPIVKVPDLNKTIGLRASLNIPKNALVFGMHQREGVGNNIPLEAFARCNFDNSYFIILGGSDIHRRCYSERDNIIFLPPSSSVDYIHQFLSTLDVYAHSRNDGEVCSACITEAMAHGLPIISHVGYGPNYGHLEQLSGCGMMSNDLDEYTHHMNSMAAEDLRAEYGVKSKDKYRSEYEYDVVVDKYLQLLN